MYVYMGGWHDIKYQNLVVSSLWIIERDILNYLETTIFLLKTSSPNVLSLGVGTKSMVIVSIFGNVTIMIVKLGLWAGDSSGQEML